MNQGIFRKPKRILFVFIVLILVAIFLWFKFQAGKNNIAENAKVFTENNLPQKNNLSVEEKDDFVGNYKVVRVIDGDTIEISGGEKVRYIGMDAPETVDPKMPVQCFGPEASTENRTLVEGKTVRLEKNVSERDKYNRLLRYVYVGDTFINLKLVQLGFARAWAYPPDTKYQNEFSFAQTQAKKSGLGLWKACQK